MPELLLYSCVLYSQAILLFGIDVSSVRSKAWRKNNCVQHPYNVAPVVCSVKSFLKPLFSKAYSVLGWMRPLSYPEH
jgi:hypothetical protein